MRQCYIHQSPGMHVRDWSGLEVEVFLSHCFNYHSFTEDAPDICIWECPSVKSESFFFPLVASFLSTSCSWHIKHSGAFSSHTLEMIFVSSNDPHAWQPDKVECFNFKLEREKMEALCSSTWSVARSYRDSRLHGSVSPQIIRGIDFCSLASFYSWGRWTPTPAGKCLHTRASASLVLLKHVSNPWWKVF